MMVLVTGGASSGKSAYAEDVALSFPGPHSYLAAMKPYGEEAARRIERHRALRAGKGFHTVECHEGLARACAQVAADMERRCGGSAVPPSVAPGAANALSSSSDARLDAGAGTALLECLGNVVANELFSDDGTRVSAEEALEAVLKGIEALSRTFDNIVVVGNEVGCDGVRYDEGTASYIEVVGAASCAIAQRCDVVVECISAHPSFVKGVLP